LKVTTENTGTREVVLTIEPDADRVNRAKRQAARAISNYRPVPGFRPGKAPLTMVERIFGRDTIINEAVSRMANDVFLQAIQEAEIEPFEPGEFEVVAEDPLTLKIKVALMPTVDLGDYHNVRIDPLPPVQVTDEMIDAEIEALRERAAEYVPAEHVAANLDQVVLEMKGTVDDDVVIEEDAAEIVLDFNEEPIVLVEKLLGMEPGQSAEIDVEYPEDYREERLAGKMVHLAFTVKQVREKELPELNDDFAKDVGDYETLDELWQKTSDSIREELEDERRQKEREAALGAFMEHAKIEYPAVAVDREVDGALQRQQDRLQRMGIEWESYLRMVGRTDEALRAETRESAEKAFVRRLVLAELARAEELEVQQVEIDARLDQMAAAYGEQADGIRERLVESRVEDSIRNDLLAQKALDLIVAIVTGQHNAPVVAQAEEAEGGDATETPQTSSAEDPPELADEQEDTSEDAQE